MIVIGDAEPSDIPHLIQLEMGLFAEDAGVHDRFADTTWPLREGRQDLEDLISSPTSVVLVARPAPADPASSTEPPPQPLGFLVGYTAEASPTRQPVRFAVLRSLYVLAEARRSGAGHLLVDRFVTWAKDRGCAEAQVSHYADNHGAALFYDQVGFTPQSISRTLPLQ